MRPRLSLRSRFLVALLPLIALVVCAFGVAVAQFIELLETELLEGELALQMQEFAEDYSRNPDRAAPKFNDLTGYIVRGETDALALPPGIAQLGPGLHDDIPIEGREHLVGRKDIGATRLYLALDIAPVEALEARVLAISMVAVVVALILATLVAVVLARVVTEPVTRLAGLVAALDPRERGPRLHEQFGDDDVGVIAGAIDGYVDRLDRLVEREQAFTEDASHELRTPLSVIGGAVQLLKEDESLSPRARDRLLRVERATSQMQSLIEALLYLAREDGGAEVQACALQPLIEDAAEACRHALTGKPVSLHLDLQPVEVQAPPGMPAVIINNLLINAANFTQTGRIDVKLTASELSISDTGAGIAPEDLAHIFERRYRGEGSRGLGLGLYLVKRICDELGWRVRVESLPGASTRFLVDLVPTALTKS